MNYGLMVAKSWLRDAKDGDESVSGHLLHFLAQGVLKQDLELEFRQFLAAALDAIANAPSGPSRAAIAKKELLLNRRPGRATKAQMRQRKYELAMEVWDEVGSVQGEDLKRGLQTVAARHEASVRYVQLAFLEYRPAFLEIQSAAYSFEEAHSLNFDY